MHLLLIILLLSFTLHHLVAVFKSIFNVFLIESTKNTLININIIEWFFFSLFSCYWSEQWLIKRKKIRENLLLNYYFILQKLFTWNQEINKRILLLFVIICILNYTALKCKRTRNIFWEKKKIEIYHRQR